MINDCVAKAPTDKITFQTDEESEALETTQLTAEGRMI